jgi:two-component system chemotaxis response regulator CheY
MEETRIVVVDDSTFSVMYIRNILESNGFDVVGDAENGMKAIEKYKELSPDLILMDITMPELDGISAVKAIKKLNNDAKIIMCSAMGQQAMVIEAIQSGAKDFMPPMGSSFSSIAFSQVTYSINLHHTF